MKPLLRIIAFLIVAFCCSSQSRSTEPNRVTLACRRVVIVTDEFGSSPAYIDWTPDLRLMAAIAASGRFAREAPPEVVIIRHVLRKDGRLVRHPKVILKGAESDPKLLPNDMIEVPK